MKRSWPLLLFFVSLVGIVDAGYLTYEHFSNRIVPCSQFFLSDCNKVLTSVYSQIYGIPLALIGLLHYVLFFIFLILALFIGKKIFKYLLLYQSVLGFLVSLYLFYLQLFIIKSICFYCMISFLTSLSLFFLTFYFFKRERVELVTWKLEIAYKLLFKPLFFLIEPEKIHEVTTSLAEKLTKLQLFKKTINWLLNFNDPVLEQTIAGINFKNPIGLAAGFDYKGQLPQMLPVINFGFGTIGTITNESSPGNNPPRLGRLPKSRSLMVNKGFKNPGVETIVNKLKKMEFPIPIGISVGQSNSTKINSRQLAIADIIRSFKSLEQSKLKISFYELNISCPNLVVNVSFYQPGELKELHARRRDLH